MPFRPDPPLLVDAAARAVNPLRLDPAVELRQMAGAVRSEDAGFGQFGGARAGGISAAGTIYKRS